MIGIVRNLTLQCECLIKSKNVPHTQSGQPAISIQRVHAVVGIGGPCGYWPLITGFYFQIRNFRTGTGSGGQRGLTKRIPIQPIQFTLQDGSSDNITGLKSCGKRCKVRPINGVNFPNPPLNDAHLKHALLKGLFAQTHLHDRVIMALIVLQHGIGNGIRQHCGIFLMQKSGQSLLEEVLCRNGDRMVEPDVPQRFRHQRHLQHAHDQSRLQNDQISESPERGWWGMRHQKEASILLCRSSSACNHRSGRWASAGSLERRTDHSG